MSAIQGLLKLWSEWKDSRDFQNCPLYHGCPLSRVPLYIIMSEKIYFNSNHNCTSPKVALPESHLHTKLVCRQFHA